MYSPQPWSCSPGSSPLPRRYVAMDGASEPRHALGVVFEIASVGNAQRDFSLGPHLGRHHSARSVPTARIDKDLARTEALARQALRLLARYHGRSQQVRESR